MDCKHICKSADGNMTTLSLGGTPSVRIEHKVGIVQYVSANNTVRNYGSNSRDVRGLITDMIGHMINHMKGCAGCRSKYLGDVSSVISHMKSE